jgi:hypothetical protein
MYKLNSSWYYMSFYFTTEKQKQAFQQTSHLTHKMPSGQRAMTVLCSTTIDNKKTAELWANSILKNTNLLLYFLYLDYIHHRE